MTQQKPYRTLWVGYGLIGAEAALLVYWFVWEQYQFQTHDLAASSEALMVAPHFVVLLSLCTLLSELEHVCREGVCRSVNTSYAWLAPAAVSAWFDILGLQRAVVFFGDDLALLGVNAFGLFNSTATIAWCLFVLFELNAGKVADAGPVPSSYARSGST